MVLAIVLLVIDRYGLQSVFVNRYGATLMARGYSENAVNFLAQIYFSSFCLACFVGVPWLWQRIFPAGLDDPFGLSCRQCRPHLPVYAALLGFMLPVLWWISARPAFQHFYPMYDPSGLSMWAAFEAVYMLQFFCVEFFFRGALLLRLEQRFGYHAVAMMVVPYAWLHIHKPFPEALASIIAGLTLGALVLKTRSIWPGVAVHCGVAFAMDLFALIRSGRLAALLP